MAVAGGNVEHARPGVQVERFAQIFADNLQRGAYGGIVAAARGRGWARRTSRRRCKPCLNKHAAALSAT